MKKEPTIEEMLAKLDETVRTLSDSGTSLEDALTLYAQAAKDIGILSKKLDSAEVRMTDITKQLAGESTNAEN